MGVQEEFWQVQGETAFGGMLIWALGPMKNGACISSCKSGYCIFPPFTLRLNPSPILFSLPNHIPQFHISTSDLQFHLATATTPMAPPTSLFPPVPVVPDLLRSVCRFWYPAHALANAAPRTNREPWNGWETTWCEEIKVVGTSRVF